MSHQLPEPALEPAPRTRTVAQEVSLAVGRITATHGCEDQMWLRQMGDGGARFRPAATFFHRLLIQKSPR